MNFTGKVKNNRTLSTPQRILIYNDAHQSPESNLFPSLLSGETTTTKEQKEVGRHRAEWTAAGRRNRLLRVQASSEEGRAVSSASLGKIAEILLSRSCWIEAGWQTGRTMDPGGHGCPGAWRAHLRLPAIRGVTGGSSRAHFFGLSPRPLWSTGSHSGLLC